MKLVTVHDDGSVTIGAKTFPTVYAAQHQWGLARQKVRSPFKKLFATAVLIELKALES